MLGMISLFFDELLIKWFNLCWNVFRRILDNTYVSTYCHLQFEISLQVTDLPIQKQLNWFSRLIKYLIFNVQVAGPQKNATLSHNLFPFDRDTFLLLNPQTDD